MKDIILEILKHKNTRWAFVILMIVIGVFILNIESFNGFGISFNTVDLADESIIDTLIVKDTLQ